MFGGLAFMVSGHMCCGIVGKDLVVRTGPQAFDEALRKPHSRPMDFTGRPMKGFVFVAPAGCHSDRDLKSMGTARTRLRLGSTAKVIARATLQCHHLTCQQFPENEGKDAHRVVCRPY
jgi:hypothetical protein